MNTIDRIDEALRSLTDRSHQDRFDRWRQEYRQRYYIGTTRATLPIPNTNPPGFEKNLHALLFTALGNNDPHSEWPYASYIDKSDEKVDIHLIINSVEVWLELGMYASGEAAKYSRDFDKLVYVVDKSPNSIGVLIHFEIYGRNVVAPIFRDMRSKSSRSYDINIRSFPEGTSAIAHRLSVQKRGR